MLLGEGGMLVDPANDLADDVMGFVARRLVTGDEVLVQRVHYLTLSPTLAFRYDPLGGLPHRSAVSRTVYENALRVKVDRLFRQIMRRVPAAELEVMNRMKRRMKAALAAAAVDLDGRGEHLGMGEVLSLAEPSSPRFRGLLDRAFPNLPESFQNAYREITGERVMPQAKDRWESTQNRLDEVLSPFVTLALSPGPSIDFKSVVRNHEFVVCRMGQTPDWTYDQAVTMGGILIDALLEVKEAEENAPPHLRVPFTLVVDEVGDYIGEDLLLALRNDRKFLLRIVLGAQNTTTLIRGEIDMAAYVLSLCQTVVCFSQKLRKDKEIIADRLFSGNVGFTKRILEIQRQRGYLTIDQEEHSYSDSETASEGAGVTNSKTVTGSGSEATGRVRSAGWSDTEGESETATHSDSSSHGRSESSGAATTMQPIVIDGIQVGAVPVPSQNASGGNSSQKGAADGLSVGKTETHSESGSVSDTVTRVTGRALALGEGTSTTTGTARGKGHTVSHKRTMLANVVSEWEWNGQYEEGSVQDQQEMVMRYLHILKSAEAFVSVLGRPYAFPIKVEHVRPAWNSPAAGWEATEKVKRLVAAQWPYTFSPAAEVPPAAIVVKPLPQLPAGPPPAPSPDAARPPLKEAQPEENKFGN